MKKFEFKRGKKTWLLIFFLVCMVYSGFALTIKMTRTQSMKARSDFVKLAKTFVGTPYVYGGTDPRSKAAGGDGGFDCSGFVGYVVSHTKVGVSEIKENGKTVLDSSGKPRDEITVKLPRRAEDIYNCKWVKKVSDKSALEPGDLVFFKTTGNGRISHVGIYIGGLNRQFISAISDGPNAGVVVSSLNQDYWKKSGVYAGAGRLF